MEQVFDKIVAEYEAAHNRVLEEHPKVIALYAELERQRDAVHSKGVKELLSAEIEAYYALNRAFDEVMEIQAAKIKASNERMEEIVPNCNEAQFEALQSLYLLNNIIPAKNTLELYCDAVDRDFKDWATFKKLLIQIGVDKIVGNIPVAAYAKSLFDIVSQVKEIVDEYNDNCTDYSEIDKQLLKIEVHTEIMKNTTQLFLYHAEVLKSNDPEE